MGGPYPTGGIVVSWLPQCGQNLKPKATLCLQFGQVVNCDGVCGGIGDGLSDKGDPLVYEMSLFSYYH